jgi:hypothetical protein
MRRIDMPAVILAPAAVAALYGWALFDPPLIAPFGRLTPGLILTFLCVIIAGGMARPAPRIAPYASPLQLAKFFERFAPDRD